MIARRQVLTGGLMGGVASALTAPDAEAALQDAAGINVSQIVRALDTLRSELRSQRQFTEIAPLRDAQLAFLRSNGKLPDFIDVGTDLWFAAHDWHIRWQQPLNITRDGSGRLTLLLMSTTLVLRPETQGNYMSLPYDTRG